MGNKISYLPGCQVDRTRGCQGKPSVFSLSPTRIQQVVKVVSWKTSLCSEVSSCLCGFLPCVALPVPCHDPRAVTLPPHGLLGGR